MTKPLYKPGQDNKPAGEYVEVGPRGEKVKGARRVEIDPVAYGPLLPQGPYIFIFLFEKQKHLPNRLNCIHASAYLCPFSSYFVM